jgi:hypothetical protein
MPKILVYAVAVGSTFVLAGCNSTETPAIRQSSETTVATTTRSSSPPPVPPVGNENCPQASNAEVSQAIGIPVTSSHQSVGSQVGCEFDFEDGTATSSYLTLDIKTGQNLDNALRVDCHDVETQNVRLEGIGTEAYLCAPVLVWARVAPDKGFTVFISTSAARTTLRPDAAQEVARLVAPRIAAE